jgi:hypothetical protein
MSETDREGGSPASGCVSDKLPFLTVGLQTLDVHCNAVGLFGSAKFL